MYLKTEFQTIAVILKLNSFYLLLVGASSVWFLCPFDRIFAVCFLTVWCDQSFRLIFYIVASDHIRSFFQEALVSFSEI